jgi:hypothetical protein
MVIVKLESDQSFPKRSGETGGALSETGLALGMARAVTATLTPARTAKRIARAAIR